MKVLIINCNPKLDFSSANWFYTPFIKGLEQEGCIVEKYYLYHHKINPCKGCLNCWFEGKGECIYEDDIMELTEKHLSSNYIIFISPVYIGSFPSYTYHYFHRMVSALVPDYSIYRGHCGHKLRAVHDIKGFGLISWCGFYELDNFNVMNEQMKSHCYSFSIDYSFCITRPHINYFLFYQDEKKNFQLKMNKAGREFAKTGTISADIKMEIEKDLIEKNIYLRKMNKYLNEKEHE
ncbi:MAG: flavodoxin family protein [Bacteroidales bacterium]|nr:flavodoxin family protein [Bacteroidales bacterium]